MRLSIYPVSRLEARCVAWGGLCKGGIKRNWVAVRNCNPCKELRDFLPVCVSKDSIAYRDVIVKELEMEFKECCEHPDYEQMEVGSLTFGGGELIDTRVLIVVCKNCGTEVWSENKKEDKDEIPF